MIPPASRNAPCPCGSGRRYKDCHGAFNASPEPVVADPDRLIGEAEDALDGGDLPAAARAARAVHAIDPEHPEAWDVLATCALLESDVAEALACSDRAIAARPDYAPYHIARGRALYGIPDIEGAEHAWRTALTLDGTDPEATFCLGNSARDRGAHDEAVRIFEDGLRNHPHDAQMMNGLGLALGLAGDDEAARRAYERALAEPDAPEEAHANLGRLLHRRQDFAGAAAHYAAFVAQSADPPADVWWALGLCQHRLGLLLSAETSYREALRRAPDNAEVKHELAAVLVELGEGAEAVRILTELAGSPKDVPRLKATLGSARQLVCDWTDWEAMLDDMRARIARVDGSGDDTAADNPIPLGTLALPLSPPELATVARRLAATIPRIALPPVPTARNDSASRRLRIAYVSSDFRPHPIPYLMTELWERHDRNRFEVFAYSLRGADDSPLRRRIEHAFEHFVDVDGEAADATVRRIRNDGIDILIDLNGYTSGSRLELFAARPAPVQMHWLGFLGTQGAEWFDYIVTDRFVTPPEMAPHFVERFLYVPGGYTPSDTRRPIDPVPPSRGALGLPANAFVFCCFNSAYKIVPPVFDAWMRIMGAIDGSVLWLSPADAATCANLRREAGQCGIAAQRLVFAPRVDLSVYLARLALADLFLDTWPYNAGTTANDALFVGLPLLTRAGETMASRVAASQLLTMGMPELVTDDPADYEKKAIELARNPKRLAALREKLRVQKSSSPLFDMERYTRGFESALETAWDEHRRRR